MIGDIDIGFEWTARMMESPRLWIRVLAIIIELLHVALLVALGFGMFFVFWILGQVV